jgi:hypothetical protein
VKRLPHSRPTSNRRAPQQLERARRRHARSICRRHGVDLSTQLPEAGHPCVGPVLRLDVREADDPAAGSRTHHHFRPNATASTGKYEDAGLADTGNLAGQVCGGLVNEAVDSLHHRRGDVPDAASSGNPRMTSWLPGPVVWSRGVGHQRDESRRGNR